jgi:hypothetical protein
MENQPPSCVGIGVPKKERCRICEVPWHKAYFFDNGHADANTS